MSAWNRHVLCSGAIAALVLAVAGATAPAAGAASTPSISHATALQLCAGLNNEATAYKCQDTLTAVIPAGTAFTPDCSHGGYYYGVVKDHHNQAGYLPEAYVTGAPPPLPDCNTPASQYTLAAVNAIHMMGSTSYGEHGCLAFVADMWNESGSVQVSGDPNITALQWWQGAYDAQWERHTKGNDPSRWLKPPRGALVFWNDASGTGHVAFSVGNGWIVTTHEGASTNAIHLMTIADRNKENGVSYLGWVMPSA